MIPKILHYVWLGGNPLTSLAEQCLASWRDHMPDWEYKWWNKDVDALINNDRLDIGHCRLEIERNVSYLHAIVGLCNAHNVQPVIVQMPVIGEYKRQLPPEQVALMDDVLQSLDSSVAICIDASEWEIPEDGWYNATHITKEASWEFSIKLVDEINMKNE